MNEWGHALSRIAERVPDVDGIAALVRAAEQTFRHDSVAVRLAVLPAHRGQSDPDYYARMESNGDEVWAVIRDGRCATVMLRRKDQRRTPEAFGVDRIMYAKTRP